MQTPIASPGPRRGLGRIAGLLLLTLAVVGTAFWFVNREREVALPEGFGGLTRVDDPQAELVVELFRNQADALGLEGDMGMYGASGFDAVIGGDSSIVASGKTTETVGETTYVCAPVEGVAPGAICMWQDDDVFWLLLDSGQGFDPGRQLAVVAQEAIASG